MKEITILEEFAPKTGAAGGGMSSEELIIEVKKVMQGLGLGDTLAMKDLGNVMKAVIKAVQGKAEGKEVSEAVKKFVK